MQGMNGLNQLTVGYLTNVMMIQHEFKKLRNRILLSHGHAQCFEFSERKSNDRP